MQLHLPTNQHIFCLNPQSPLQKKKQLHLLQQIRRKQAVERADGGRGKAYISKKKKNRLCFLFLRNVGKLDYLFFISKPCARTGAVARHTFLRSLFFFVNVVDCEVTLQSILCHGVRGSQAYIVTLQSTAYTKNKNTS
jgi:hypothetical protein